MPKVALISSEKRAGPIIRWAGSKLRLLPHLIENMPPTFGTYYEPFVGSGCLFFAIHPQKAVLGDLNPTLIEVYDILGKEPKCVVDKARRMARTSTNYYRIRSKFSLIKEPVQRAATFLFLNRLCFNGIYRTNKKGEFNVPFGSRMGQFPTLEKFRLAATVLARANLYCGDFENTISGAQAGDFVYLDPPYVYKKHKDRGEYGPNSFRIKDLERLNNAIHDLDKKGVRFLLSYVDCEEARKLAASYKSIHIPVKRCIASLSSKRKVVDEILIKNY